MFHSPTRLFLVGQVAVLRITLPWLLVPLRHGILGAQIEGIVPGPRVRREKLIMMVCVELNYYDILKEIVEVDVMKSQPHLIDVPHQDDVFQENVDIHNGSAIDVIIEDVGPLIHESRSSEELDIIVETYFDEVQIDETKIE
ncbi:hypothetical protein M9H77_03033 [Catharanthus roseus]|uniref:Uncharacterized protein n=1 Tax=Catharanthus roseus TaxID=4058 RepID=A0ACC0CAA2_CATRO|nr:hypothetical protein M9H77_03033 [Catharanthus roseus]